MKPPERIVPYDFRQPDPIPPEQMRMLRLLTESSARGFASGLSNCLRVSADARLRSLQVVPPASFLAGLPAPACMIAFRIRSADAGVQVDASALAEISPDAAFVLIEILLGSKQPGAADIRRELISRELTSIERQILQTVWSQVLRGLSGAWQPLSQLDLRLEEYETDPGLVTSLPPDEQVIHAAIEVQAGEAAGTLNLALPSALLQLLRPSGAKRNPSASAVPDPHKILSAAAGAKLEMAACLEGAMVSFEDILGLREGDILQFDQPSTDPVTILLNGVRKYRGKLTTSGGRKAITIEERTA